MDDTITTLRSREIYRNRWMVLHEDDVRFPGGHEGIYGWVTKPHFVVVVPLFPDGTLELVRVYRYPLGRSLWEFPQGAWETEPGADPVEVAHGELREETGLTAGTLEKTADMHAAYGFVDHPFTVFLATDLTRGAPQREATELAMTSARFTLDQIVQMIAEGEITDAQTIAALGHLRLTGRL